VTAQELRAKAATDLAAPKTGVLLEWSFLAAEAAGEQAAAEKRLAFLERIALDCREAQMRAYPPPEAMSTAIAAFSVGDAQLERAREALAGAVAAKDLATRVLALLERPRKVAEVVPLKPVADEPRRAAK
jgi:hypothetical protein